ncbi:MAG: hypothetical protein JWP85_12 [Rhodoglobus sp.]|nr:hypothetical protein [Rhodoglobus sp.]
MASETKRTPTEAEFITAIESGPLTQIEVIEATDGTGLIVTARAADPDTGDDIPLGITLDPSGGAYIVTIETEELIISRDQLPDQDASSVNARQVGPLRKLHELATRLEQEAKGKARDIAERLRLKRND